MCADADPAQRRRSGFALEAALLDAAWDELVQAGYARLTMNSVAARAGTSEPVLYRRWPNKDHLVLAALARRRDAKVVVSTDTGSLREDLIAELTSAAQAFAGFYAIAAAAAFSGLSADSDLTPAQVRDQLMNADANPAPSPRRLYLRAAERGEIDLDRLPVAVLEAPFDLIRHDLLMTMGVPSAERVRAIVDDVAMPAITEHMRVAMSREVDR